MLHNVHISIFLNKYVSKGTTKLLKTEFRDKFVFGITGDYKVDFFIYKHYPYDVIIRVVTVLVSKQTYGTTVFDRGLLWTPSVTLYSGPNHKRKGDYP